MGFHSIIMLYLLTISLIFNGFVRSDILQPGSLLGVAPQDQSYYASDTIKCKDGSNKFTKSQLNDDYCDCLDGSDEPGTSACPNGSFYCKNAGHSPVVLYSSRVNDAICDCCDGSDEYDGKIKCPNTCWEAGKVAREKLMKKIATYQEGVTIRKHEIEKAKLTMAKEESELSKLKDEEKVLKGLVDQLKDRKEQIEKIEEKERLQKEKEEKERMEAELAAKKEAGTDEKSETAEHIENDFHDRTETAHQPPQEYTDDHQESELSDHPIKEELPNDGAADVNEDILQTSEQQKEGSTVDGKVDTEDGNQEKNAGEDTESLSREELGRRIASRWTGEKVDEQTQEDGSVNTDDLNIDGTSSEANGEEYPGYDSDEDEHTYDEDDDDDKDPPVDDFQPDDHYDATPHVPDSDDESDMSDVTDSGSSSWLEKIQQTVKNIIRVANIFQTPVNISDAAHVRKEYDESSAKLSKIQSRISSLTKKLKQDFGSEKEFYSFYGQCFETKQNKYTYKVCPFKQATQEEGYSTTRLGSWDKFEDSYRVMQFSNGDKCWNGPDRSLKVKLRCGLKNEVTDVDEPSRCEYMALLSTPALCVETKLKELQEKLESLNKKQPHGHDEL